LSPSGLRIYHWIVIGIVTVRMGLLVLTVATR
jgi:hypothetical protein